MCKHGATDYLSTRRIYGWFASYCDSIGPYLFSFNDLNTFSQRGHWYDVDDNEVTLWKYNFAFLQLFLIITPSHHACKMRSKIMELDWNQLIRAERTKLKICRQVLTSSTQQQNMSFHVVEKDKNGFELCKDEKCTYKTCKTIVFRNDTCKFVLS